MPTNAIYAISYATIPRDYQTMNGGKTKFTVSIDNTQKKNNEMLRVYGFAKGGWEL